MNHEQTQVLTLLSEKITALNTSKKVLADKKKKLLVEIKMFEKETNNLEREIIKSLGGLDGIMLPNKTKISVITTKSIKLIKGTDLETLPEEFVKLALDLTEVKKAYKENPFLVDFMEENIKQKVKIK